MKTVALVVNIGKRDARAALEYILTFLKEIGVNIISDPETAAFIGEAGMGRPPEGLREEADLLVSVGGDGTVLKAARLLAGSDAPLLGVNLGGLGFLTACSVEEARELIRSALKGECLLEGRLLLKASLRRGGGEICSYVLLNDAVITRGALSRLIALETFIDEDYLATFFSDGLIVSTPTGSTAYSLSAGGPLVSPDTDAIIISPICPHTLTNRPLVIPSGKRVRVVISARAADNALTIDGQMSEALRDGDEVHVERFGRRLMLVVSTGKDYFSLLREKLQWGGRVRHG